MRSTEWHQLQDFFYHDAAERRLRTRVHYDTRQLTLASEHVHKRVLKNVTFDANVKLGDKTGALRVALATEQPVRSEELPNVVTPKWVRLRARRSFFWGGTRDAPVWRYDFTLNWHAATRDAAEQKQKLEPPTCEIECELLDRSYAAAHDPEHTAVSLLLKARDLLSESPLFSPTSVYLAHPEL